MSIITEAYKIEFYKFLNGDISLREIESLVFRQSELEQHLEEDIYDELLNFDFQDHYANDLFRRFTFQHIIQEGQFETWKLTSLLLDFLKDTHNIHNYLDKLYHLYCGVYQEHGPRKYQYRFLSHLGLNYFYWLDVDYLKATHGDNWEQAHKRAFDDFEFYHAQLKPFAEEILSAINEKRIQIYDDGTYFITDDLKERLESETIFQLMHPNEK